MSTPQNTIAIIYDYDQTLSPSYMQGEVVIPALGIDGPKFWTRCSELVHRIVEQRKSTIETGTARAPKH